MVATRLGRTLDLNDRPTVLATDLDGTLIPLHNDLKQQRDLSQLKAHFRDSRDSLVFVTGRHLDSTREAILQYQLPCPDWIICDVGTTIVQCDAQLRFFPVTAYRDLLAGLITTCPLATLRERLSSIPELRLQEPEKQGAFKLSFYTDGDALEAVSKRVHAAIAESPFSVIASLDPFNHDGLIDLVPTNVSKAFALQWWSQIVGHSRQRIVFAGDSGNDLAALTAGYLSILVGNASKQVVQAAAASHRKAGWQNCLYLAKSHATSGVLEGCRHYGLVG